MTSTYIGTKLLDRVSDLRRSLDYESREVTARLGDIVAELEHVIPKVQPSPIPESVQELQVQYSKIVERYQAEEKEAWARFDRHERLPSLMKELNGLLQGHIEEFGYDPRVMESDTVQLKKLRQKCFLEVDAHRRVLVQTKLFEIVENRSKAVKSRFWRLYLAEVGAHLKSRSWGNPRPLVFLDFGHYSHRKTPNRSDSRLPGDIMLMVYSYCDLETCVSLREVNSGWFGAFKHLEPRFKSMLKHRNPWISPGDGDLITWTDCVLMFVARLKSPNWKKIDSWKEIVLPSVFSSRHTVVASELKLGEFLPDDFKSLVAEEDACGTEQCRHFHTRPEREEMGQPIRDNKKTHLTMNMWTGETVKDTTSTGIRVPCHEREDLSDDKETVLEYEGVLITLPRTITPPPDSSYRSHYYTKRVYRKVDMFPSWITVSVPAESKLWVFPRDKPHYRHGVALDGYAACREIQGILVVQDLYLGVFFLVDIESESYQILPLTWVKKFHREFYDEINYSRDRDVPPCPSASYDGAIWWSIPMGILVPTFVDLKQPGDTFYRPDRIISGPRGFGNKRFVQGDKSRDLGRYMVGGNFCDRTYSSSVTEVVDLESRTVTTVKAPYHGRNGYFPYRFYLGFLEGRFQARYMTPETVWDTRKKIEKEWKQAHE